MIKKTIEYVDYAGNPRKEDFYFNLTKAELMEMNMSVDGGMRAKMTRIIQAQSMPEIFETFNSILKKAYGVISDDGRRFMKSEELFNAFKETEAYSALVMELLSDPKAAAAFASAIIPSDLASAEDIEKEATAMTADLIPTPGN